MRSIVPVTLLLVGCLSQKADTRGQRALDSAAAAAGPAIPPQAYSPLPPRGDSLVGWPWVEALVRANPDSILAVYQTHARAVTVALRNGRRYRATEPAIDDIIRLLRQVDPAGRILIATE